MFVLCLFEWIDFEIIPVLSKTDLVSEEFIGRVETMFEAFQEPLRQRREQLLEEVEEILKHKKKLLKLKKKLKNKR